MARGAGRGVSRQPPASVGRAWNPIARTYSTLAKIIHTDHSYTHSVYGLYVGSTTITAICKSGPRSLLIG